MPNIIDGGNPHTSLVQVTTTPTLLAPARTAPPPKGTRRSLLVIQQAGTVDVYIGGPDVVASGLPGSPMGYRLIATPVTNPPTADAAVGLATSGAAYYGVVASGVGLVRVLEEF